MAHAAEDNQRAAEFDFFWPTGDATGELGLEFDQPFPFNLGVDGFGVVSDFAEDPVLRVDHGLWLGPPGPGGLTEEMGTFVAPLAFTSVPVDGTGLAATGATAGAQAIVDATSAADPTTYPAHAEGATAPAFAAQCAGIQQAPAVFDAGLNVNQVTNIVEDAPLCNIRSEYDLAQSVPGPHGPQDIDVEMDMGSFGYPFCADANMFAAAASAPAPAVNNAPEPLPRAANISETTSLLQLLMTRGVNPLIFDHDIEIEFVLV